MDLMNKGLVYLSKNNFTSGDFYTGTYAMSSINGKDGQRIIWQSLKDLFSGKSIGSNKFTSAENWLGSYGFSMRVTGDGRIAVAVYDSKSIESATDHKPILQKAVPQLSTTYQRYIWYISKKSK